jgi:hypothetical protein
VARRQPPVRSSSRQTFVFRSFAAHRRIANDENKPTRQRYPRFFRKPVYYIAEKMGMQGIFEFFRDFSGRIRRNSLKLLHFPKQNSYTPPGVLNYPLQIRHRPFFNILRTFPRRA